MFQSNFKNTSKHVLVGFDGPMVVILIRDSYGTVRQVRAGELNNEDVGEGEVDAIQDSFKVLEGKQGRHEYAGAIALVELDQGAGG